MKETTYTINVPAEPVAKKKPRSSKKRRARFFFVILLLVLFGLSYGITSLVLFFSPSVTPTSELPEPETEETGKVEVSAPDPVTEPQLPTILKGTTTTETEEPLPEEETEEPIGETEEPADEPSEDPSEEEPTEEEPVKEEEPKTDESRKDGLR